jgi:hypothetical protein
MEHEHFVINIDGAEADDLYPHLISLEVELDEELVAMARVQLALASSPDGAWPLIDDPRLRPWRNVTVTAGFDGSQETLFEGFIASVRPAFDPDLTHCTLELWAYDRGALMDRAEQLRAWPDKKDSDIAAAIFAEYGLTAAVDDTETVHDATVSTIVQRETDLMFLRRLAQRNGFECYVEGARGYFQAPRLGEPPQPDLAVHFGPDTNVGRLDLEVEALLPTSVAGYQVDRVSKAIFGAEVTVGRQPLLGRSGPPAGPATGGPPLVVLGQVPVTGLPELLALGESLYHQGAWFVRGEGELLGNCYHHVLRPRRTVELKGVGEQLSGRYYVAHVTHRFVAGGYMQRFRLRRNAVGTGAGAPLGAGAGALRRLI